MLQKVANWLIQVV